MSKDICVVRHVLTPHLKYSLNIPMGYKIEQYEVTVEKEIRYVYKDSSFIYITNFCNTPNYGNIKSLGDSILQYRFQNEELMRFWENPLSLFYQIPFNYRERIVSLYFGKILKLAS